jgi:AraC-like DNA-binding protein
MFIGEFIKDIRLKQAAHLLATSLNVTEIFFRTGFNNQSSFPGNFANDIIVHRMSIASNNQFDPK